MRVDAHSARARRAVVALLLAANVTVIWPSTLRAATIVAKGASLTAAALPLLILPDGVPLSPTDILLESWNLHVRDDDVVVLNGTAPIVLPDSPPLTVCAVTEGVPTNVALVDPLTLAFYPFAGPCDDLSAILDRPGSIAVLGDFFVATVSEDAEPIPTASQTPAVTTIPTPPPTATLSPNPISTATSTVLPSPTQTANPSGTTAATATATSPLPTPTPSATPVGCIGDCSLNGFVTSDELLVITRAALGGETAVNCVDDSPNPADRITIGEILTAVTNAFRGCPPMR